jgi:hypothetical protein
MLLAMMVFMPSYQAPTTNNPIENRDDCVVLINESFENGFPPENWTNTGWLDSFLGEPYDGDHWAYSWTFGDELTTPPLEFDVNTTLTFWYRVESATHPQQLEVYVNDTLIWADYEILNDEYEMVTVSLDSYSGLNTILFYNSGYSDFYGLMIDAVEITTIPVEISGEVLICESFENGFPPENWTNIGWQDSYPYGEPYHGDHWAFSWSSGDKLTTPPLEFGDRTTLTFWYRNEYANHPQWLEVYVNETLVWYDYAFGYEDYVMGTVSLDSYSGIKTISFFDPGKGKRDFYGQMLDMIMVTTAFEDVNQSTHDRGFPIRHALDGDWGAAQNFSVSYNHLAYAEIYLRKFGTPEFNLTVELRENHPQGPLIDSRTFTPDQVSSSWEMFEVNFNDTTVQNDTDYFIVIPPAPSGVTTSFGYEWGYAFGNQYDDGSFWFTRDGGGLWRDLPTMYEFAFRTFGYS